MNSDNRLPRSKKILKKNDFLHLKKNAKSFSSKSFRAYWINNTNSTGRLGITLKGKISTTYRAKIKRVVREWFRQARESSLPVDLNIVVFVSDSFSFKDISNLKASLFNWNLVG